MARVFINFPTAGDQIINGEELNEAVAFSGRADGLKSGHHYSVELVVKDLRGNIVDSFWSHNHTSGNGGTLNWSLSQSLPNLPDGRYYLNAAIIQIRKSHTGRSGWP